MTSGRAAGVALACGLLFLGGPAAAEDACTGRCARTLLAITPFELSIPSLHRGEGCFQFEQDPADDFSPAASLCVESDVQGVVTRLRWTPTSRC